MRRGLQGDPRLPDRLFPGHVRFNYPPWTAAPNPAQEALVYTAPGDARRYQPGHPCYLGYAALYEGLRFLEQLGPARVLAHTRRLNQRLLARVDRERTGA